ncbi:MAG: short chain dehydrogenase [Bacteroidales bacterium]|nr:short chain dehydrogenase [Bacteroidales bacterium]
MKILLVGGKGTIGKKVKERLELNHQVIIAGKNSGDITFNLEESISIKKLFDTIGQVDAIVSIAGEAKWDRFENLTEDDYYIGIRSKLMGQVNLVRIGKDYLSKGGSITLTSGILADEPEFMTTSAAMVNGAIHSFVKAVTLELDTIRVNVVCADVVEDSFEKYKIFFPGHTPLPMNKIVNGYIKCIEGKIRGEIVRIKE